ncbi:MAG TPA: helix-turn-helix domain-containing protein [Solirubrobacteraceae bacterium]|nr:helix-turn-helix domain-containing protein [Solirubrobacteraceae bacterium]
MSASGLDGRRAIGERNERAILDAAVRVLADRPEAGVAQVAAEAGVGRATVYRHFPTRDDLLAALRTRAEAEFRAAVRAAECEAADPETALRRLVSTLADMGGRYRVLAAPDEAGRARQAAAVIRPLRVAVERAQSEGVIDRSLSSAWAVDALLALLRASKGRLRAADRADRVVDLLLDGARPRA